MRQRPLPLHNAAELARAWNRRFPFDYWWREKFNVPFGSPQHRAMSLWDMLAEYEQQRWVLEIRAELLAQSTVGADDGPRPLFKPGQAAEFQSASELDEAFDELNIDDFDDSPAPSGEPGPAPDDDDDWADD